MKHSDVISPADQARQEAQKLFSSGYFDLAGPAYDEATELALGLQPPNYLAASISARGAGSAYNHIGSSLATSRFEEADSYFAEVEAAVQAGTATNLESYMVNRECAQRANVRGAFLLRQCLLQEAEESVVPRNEAEHTGVVLNDAKILLDAVEGKKPDQYRINGMSRYVIWTAFYGGKDQTGSRKEAIKGAWQSIDFGFMSESHRFVSETAGLGLRYRMEAKARALKRGAAALAASYLVTPEQSLRRKLARRVALHAV